MNTYIDGPFVRDRNYQNNTKLCRSGSRRSVASREDQANALKRLVEPLPHKFKSSGNRMQPLKQHSNAIEKIIETRRAIKRIEEFDREKRAGTAPASSSPVFHTASSRQRQRHKKLSEDSNNVDNSRFSMDLWKNIGQVPYYIASNNNNYYYDYDYDLREKNRLFTSDWSNQSVSTPRLLAPIELPTTNTPLKTKISKNDSYDNQFNNNIISMTPWGVNASTNMNTAEPTTPLEPLLKVLPSMGNLGVTLGSEDTIAAIGWQGPSAPVLARAKEEYESIIHQLSMQCATMSEKLLHLEAQVAIQSNVTQNLTTAKDENEKSHREADNDNNIKKHQISLESSITSKQIDQQINHMESMLSNLTSVLSEEVSHSPIARKAATTINMAVRGYLIRKQRLEAFKGIKFWRHRAVGPVLKIIDNNSAHQMRLRNQIKSLKKSRNQRIVKSVFNLLKTICIKMKPVRSFQLKAAKELKRRIELKTVKVIYTALYKSATGPGSSRAVSRSYARRFEAARRSLEALSSGRRRITAEMVKRELQKQAKVYMSSKLRLGALRRVVQPWRKYALPLQKKKKQALLHYRFYILHKIFKTWSHYTLMRLEDRIIMQPAGTQATRVQRKDKSDNNNNNNNNNNDSYNKNTKALESQHSDIVFGLGGAFFAPKHNTRVIQIHYEKTLLTKLLRHWRLYTGPRAQSSKKFETLRSTALTKAFHGWRDEAKALHKLRESAVKQWKSYSSRLLVMPFRAWYVWSIESRHTRIADTSIIKAARRRVKYRLVCKIFRYWKHLAIYGKVDGMRTRMELIQVLDDQRVNMLLLEKNCDQYKESLKDADGALVAEKIRNTEKDVTISNQTKEVTQLKLALHNAEQEMVRYQSIVDNLGKIHPGTVKRLQDSILPEEQFLDRGIVKYARQRLTDAFPSNDSISNDHSPENQSSCKACGAVITEASTSQNITDTKEDTALTAKDIINVKDEDILDFYDTSSSSESEVLDEYATGNDVVNINANDNVDTMSKADVDIPSLSKDEFALLERFNWIMKYIHPFDIKEHQKCDIDDNDSAASSSDDGSTMSNSGQYHNDDNTHEETTAPVYLNPGVLQLSAGQRYRLTKFTNSRIKSRVISLSVEESISEVHRLMALFDYLSSGNDISKEIALSLCGIPPEFDQSTVIVTGDEARKNNQSTMNGNHKIIRNNSVSDPFNSNLSWNDFLNGIAYTFPMRHPIHTDGKTRLQSKLGESYTLREKQNITIKKPLNIYSQVNTTLLKGGEITMT